MYLRCPGGRPRRSHPESGRFRSSAPALGTRLDSERSFSIARRKAAAALLVCHANTAENLYKCNKKGNKKGSIWVRALRRDGTARFYRRRRLLAYAAILGCDLSAARSATPERTIRIEPSSRTSMRAPSTVRYSAMPVGSQSSSAPTMERLAPCARTRRPCKRRRPIRQRQMIREDGACDPCRPPGECGRGLRALRQAERLRGSTTRSTIRSGRRGAHTPNAAVDACGMRQRERHVLLAEKNADGAQSL